MANLHLLVFFVLLPWSGNSTERKAQLRSRYWTFVSQNKESPFLSGNFTAILGGHFEKRTLMRRNDPEKNCFFHEARLLSSHLQSVLPPFAVTSRNVRNTQCKRDSEKFLEHLALMDLWALKMHDSSGKFPSGMLNGNINQFGDFDQCVDIDEPGLNIKGKYCLAYLQIQLIGNGQYESILQAFKLIQSHFVFKSKLTDPGHRVPRFSTINWGLCVPSSCSSQDVETHLKEIVDKYSNGTGFKVEVRTDAEMCQEKKLFKASLSFTIVSCSLLLVVTIAVGATFKDIFFTVKTPTKVSFWSVLNCFSLKRNGTALMDTSRSSDDIECVHGIRMLNAMMLLLSHKSMALFFMPYSNRTSMVENLNQPWTIIARIASLYTDSFIMISGLLSSYSFLKTLKKKGYLDLKNEYFGRLIRIMPPLITIILLCTFILPELGSGPQWNLTVSHHADKCKKTWWKNFLFIHNYLGFENMCLTHTHHLGIDTQLFLISPFLVYLLFRWPYYGISALVGLAAASTIARYQVTMAKNLSFFIYPGILVSQMFDTANFSYIIPFHRLTAYITGICLGYVLHVYGRDQKIKSHFLRFGWTVTFSFLSYILIKASQMNHPNYVYKNQEAATYAALAPVAWCLFLGWLIFVCYTGCGGVVGKIISSKYWLIWTRLSYAVYLTQFPIFFFNVGLQKYPQQYSFFLLVNILEYACVFIASVILTLFFDMPFANLKKLLIPSTIEKGNEADCFRAIEAETPQPKAFLGQISLQHHRIRKGKAMVWIGCNAYILLPTITSTLSKKKIRRSEIVVRPLPGALF